MRAIYIVTPASAHDFIKNILKAYTAADADLSQIKGSGLLN